MFAKMAVGVTRDCVGKMARLGRSWVRDSPEPSPLA